MDLFPLWNSLRIAGISTVIIFFVGIFAAYYIAKAPRAVKGVLDVILVYLTVRVYNSDILITGIDKTKLMRRLHINTGRKKA